MLILRTPLREAVWISSTEHAKVSGMAHRLCQCPAILGNESGACITRGCWEAWGIRRSGEMARLSPQWRHSVNL